MGFWYSTPDGDKYAEKDGGGGPDDHMEPTFERPYVKPTAGEFFMKWLRWLLTWTWDDILRGVVLIITLEGIRTGNIESILWAWLILASVEAIKRSKV